MQQMLHDVVVFVLQIVKKSTYFDKIRSDV